jgi:iron complex outermembrane receptor protein
MKAFSLAATACAQLLLAQGALAQTSATDAAPTTPATAPAQAAQGATASVDHDEIVVTALRRQQSVLSVPLSIQASTGDQLVKAGINDLTSLRFTTPGYSTATDSGFTQIFIRGVGNAIYVGADPSVSQFVDDVPRIYGSTADNLFDVDRIEVLKGAQGGLYGRNSTGGVVNVITRQPSTDALKADFLGSYGERNTLRAAAYANVPLGEHAAFSISAERDSHDPYVRNTATENPYSAAMFPSGAVLPFPNGTTPIAVPGVGNVYVYTPQQTASFFNVGIHPSPLNDQDFWSVSGKLLLKPTDTLKITIAADTYDKHDNNGAGFVAVTPAIYQASLAGLFSSLGVATNFPAGFIQGSTGKFTASFGPPGLINTKEWGISGTTVWSLPGLDLTSITAFRRQITEFQTDAANSTVPFAPISVGFHSKRFFYQELRAVSTFSGPLHLLGGLTYLRNRQSGETKIFFLSSQFQVGHTVVDDRIQNWSIYGEAAYDFTDRLTLTASGRFQRETNHVAFAAPVASTGSVRNQKFVPSATLSYKLDGGGTAYLRWARGFKTGGINTATAPAYYPKPTDGSVFAPETVDTFEAGYRNTLFDRRLQVTAAVFYNDYSNLQSYAHPFFGAKDAFGNEATSSITTAVINAKSARTYGVEGSAQLRVSSALNVGVNLGWLNAKYRDFTLTGSTILASFDRSGQQMPQAPKFQAAFTANLDQPLNDRLRLVSSVLVSHNSSVLFAYSSTPTVPDNGTSGYWLANARIGLRTANDRFGIALVADNVFNKEYYVQGSASAFGDNLAYGNPRVIRGEISVKY